MKIYRKSVFKNELTWMSIILFSFIAHRFITLGTIHIYAVYILLLLIAFALFMATSLNYIILDDKQITIKNSFYSFWSTSFRYEDLQMISLENNVKGKSYFRFKPKTTLKLSRFYMLGCVKNSDLKEIVAELQKHNVIVQPDAYVQKYFLK